jgi:protease secretion system membrane fusion protein
MANTQQPNQILAGLLAGASPAGEQADQQDDHSRPGRFGLWALAIAFGGFVLWAGFAPLDEGVPSQGLVSVDTKRKAVQHPLGGIVKQVLVHEGDRVKEGQPLMRLDPDTAQANYEASRQRYLGLRAMHARLVAEQVGSGSISFHPDLQAAAKDPLIRSQMQTQEQLFRARISSLRADLQAMQQSIQGQQAVVHSTETMLGSRRSQLGLVNDELKSTRELVKEGYAPRNRQLELERMVDDLNASMADLLGNNTRAQRAIDELRQRVVQRQQEYRKEVETQLADVTRDVQSEESRFRALEADLGRVEIRSPAEGQVVGLAVQTVGGVISAGQKLMDIVPDNEPLVLETRVSPHLIDSLRVGLPVDVRFSSFAHSPMLVVAGRLESISGDLLSDPQSNAMYYLARVTVTPEGMKKLGKRQLQPGMPVEVVFKTGERSMLTYLLHPLTKRIAAAMKEE